MDKKSEVDVSVLVPTYFHEKYIAQALDSILMQQTTFRFEVLVGDDASGDGTPEIIKSYAERFPDIIRPILRPENLGGTANGFDLQCRATGNYIAYLEGDDYWLDPHKLQKQREFLEHNPDYIGCCGKCMVINEYGEPDYDSAPRFFRNKKVLTLEEFLESWRIPGQAGTLMHRNIFHGAEIEKARRVYEVSRNVGDKGTILLLLPHGPIYCFNNVFSAYRYVRKGGSNYFSRHYADPYRNYHMFLYPCRLETWIKNELGIRHYNGKNKEYRFCRFVEELVREPSLRRMRYLVDMVVHSHQPAKYCWIILKALIEME